MSSRDKMRHYLLLTHNLGQLKFEQRPEHRSKVFRRQAENNGER